MPRSLIELRVHGVSGTPPEDMPTSHPGCITGVRRDSSKAGLS